MAELTPATGIARFGSYEVNVRSGEIRKFGIRIKLGEQPLRILILLMERQGELVTREELRSQLWSANTFVDFDHSLNSAVQRLREGLSDTAGKAQWIETVPRRGYRFVGSVEWTKTNGSHPDVAAAVAETPEASAVPVESHSPLTPLTAEPPRDKPAVRPFFFRRLLWFTALALGLAAGVALKVAYGRRGAKPAKAIRSLAVIPLENLSGDPSQEYFAEGLTDELITALAKNRSLRIISRTSVMQYKGVHRPVRDIAHELGVDGIVEGSVSHSADRVHLRVQLIDASTDTHVWADSYDRSLNDAFFLPSELSQTIAEEVKVATSAPTPQRYVNPEARDLYLRGRYFFFSDNNAPGREYLEKAILLQPDYAAAWSALSDYYGGRAVGGEIPPQDSRANWENDARKAIELDDSLADGHNSMAAWYFFGAWDWNRAEAESLRAIELNPNHAEAYHVYSYILTVTNRPKEAMEMQKRGMDVDPFARPWALGLAYYHQRQFEAAIADLRLREQAQPTNITTHDILADAYAAAGMERAAADEREQVCLLLGDKEGAAAIRRAFERGGYQAVMEWRIEREKADTRRKYFSPFWMALKSGQAHHKEETLKLLEDAYNERSPRLVFLQNEPAFDFLHSEPRFQDIARKVGLPAVTQ